MPQLTMAKADQQDFDEMRLFFKLIEALFPKWSNYENPVDNLDPENDELYPELNKFIIKIGDEWARGSVGDFDFQAFLESWQERIGHRHFRVLWGSEILIEQACDPTVDHLAFYPGFECFHVAPEQ